MALQNNSYVGGCLYSTKRFFSGWSLGQHYTVLFHKRRSYYSSLCCGITTVILYALIIYYAFVSFKKVIMKEEYDLVEEYRPLSLGDQNITIGHFLDTSDLTF